MLSDNEIMAQVMAAFQGEQSEHRQAIGDILLELEGAPQHPQRAKLLEQLFREAHSLKGAARAAGLVAIEQIAHRLEDVMSAVREDKLDLSPETCDPLYAGLDAIGEMAGIAATGQTPNIQGYEPLLASLDKVLAAAPGAPRPAKPAPAPAAPAPAAPVEPQSAAAEQPVAEQPAPEQPKPAKTPKAARVPTMASKLAGWNAQLSENQPTPAAQPNDRAVKEAARPQAAAAATGGDDGLWKADSTTVRLSTTTLDNMLSETGELITCTVRTKQRMREAHALADAPMRWRRLWRQIRPAIERLQALEPTLAPTVHFMEGRTDFTAPSSGLANHDDTIMVLEALQQAHNLINELDSSLALHARQTDEDHDRLAAVTQRLHDQMRGTRMLPVSSLLNPLRLQVREMARTVSKLVSLDVDDGGAQADRQVLDNLREVVMHLLRNAVDHGNEPTTARIAAGKPAEGKISLRAAVTGDRLMLQLQDDGPGIDLAAIKRRAQGAGIASDVELERMSDAELIDLIFTPGFSTKDAVTTLSGRGVGLDVVRSSVERMHGRVTVHSVAGKGTTFTISVPLSLTSTQGLVLRIGKADYVMPLGLMQRIIPVQGRDVVMLEGLPTLSLEGQPVPLVRVGDMLNGSSGMAKPTTAGTIGMAVVLANGERQVACLVDEVLEEQELMVQRLPVPLQRVRFVSGATILANGAVVPILDVVDLVQASLIAHARMKSAADNTSTVHVPTVLVVDDSITTRTLERNILEAAGYHVELATDGVEALEALRRLATMGGCDLMVSDVDMPRLNGFDLTKQLRSDPEFQHLPIILVTSLGSAADRQRGVEAGADAYIVKRAFDKQTLLDTISQLI